MNETGYDNEFLYQDAQGSLNSARIYLDYLFKYWLPKSAIDFGCGLGTWLLACKELGVPQLVGLDGSWVTKDMIVDPSIDFRPTNFTQDVSLTMTFDLALSLEVAEHLPPEVADQFVRSIARSSGAVVFSAAFTGQPGVGHINTRPHSYWATRFMTHGYLLFDLFRREFWSDERIEPWYRQNTFLYVKAEHPLHHALIAGGQGAERDARFVDCVHPWLYLRTRKDE